MKFLNFFKTRCASSFTDEDLVVMWHGMASLLFSAMAQDKSFSASKRAEKLKNAMLKVRFMALARGVEVDRDWSPPAFVFPEGKRDIPELDESVTEHD